jgi:hypothetical protein
MQLHPLSGRVVLLSWLVAPSWWLLAWLVQPVGQGLAILLAGGDWIGVGVGLGFQPWALVNEPGIAFAATRLALFSYWLSPLFAALLAAAVSSLLLPSGRGWASELGVYHLGLAAAALGLGWSPSLGVIDGSAAGLERFWEFDSWQLVVICAIVGGALASLATIRLGGHLWLASGGPTRLRRLAVPLVHAVPPAVAWMALTVVTGWPVRSSAVVTMAATVVAGPLVAAWFFTPRAPLRPRPEIRTAVYAVAGVVSVVVLTFVLWAGSPRVGRSLGLLWGTARATNNIPPGTVRKELMRRPAPTVLPARSTAGS